MNPNWEKIDCIPTEITLRDRVGVSVNKEELGNCGAIVSDLLAKSEAYEATITDVLHDHLYNIGSAGEAGADYILSSLVAKKNAKK
jgi:YidC/Oxa1 family membrane protein insertase